MRTTVNIDSELLAQVKVIAARSHRTIGSVLEDALRALIAQKQEQREEAVLPDFNYSGGLRPGVDLYDKDLMAELDATDHAVL